MRIIVPALLLASLAMFVLSGVASAQGPWPYYGYTPQTHYLQGYYYVYPGGYAYPFPGYNSGAYNRFGGGYFPPYQRFGGGYVYGPYQRFGGSYGVTPYSSGWSYMGY